MHRLKLTNKYVTVCKIIGVFMFKNVLLFLSFVALSPLCGYTCTITWVHNEIEMSQTFSDFKNNEVLIYKDAAFEFQILPNITEDNKIDLLCTVLKINEDNSTTNLAVFEMNADFFTGITNVHDTCCQSMEYTMSSGHSDGHSNELSLSISVSE